MVHLEETKNGILYSRRITGKPGTRTETVQEADAHTFFLLSFLALSGVALLLFLGSGTCGKIVSWLLR